MLAFTPAVEAALDWFDATHDVKVDGMSGRVWFAITRLPGPGSVGEQNAKLMEALTILRDTHNAIVNPAKSTPMDDVDG